MDDEPAEKEKTFRISIAEGVLQKLETQLMWKELASYVVAVLSLFAAALLGFYSFQAFWHAEDLVGGALKGSQQQAAAVASRIAAQLWDEVALAEKKVNEIERVEGDALQASDELISARLRLDALRRAATDAQKTADQAKGSHSSDSHASPPR